MVAKCRTLGIKLGSLCQTGALSYFDMERMKNVINKKTDQLNILPKSQWLNKN